jgi:rhodanese-related sulfurtransferase
MPPLICALFLAVVCMLGVSIPVYAAETAQIAAKQTTTAPVAAGPVNKAYCGVRCLYAAALAEGVELPGEQLIKTQYIGSREGSSIQELELAAHDHKLQTFAFVDGTVGTLQLASHPVILHVESDPGSGRYDHFVLYLGTHDQELLILDPAAIPGQPARALGPRELQLIWDGAGVIVSKTPVEKAVFAASWGRALRWGGAVIGMLALGKLLLVHRPIKVVQRFASLSASAEVLAVAMLALVAPPLSALCCNGGLLANSAQVKVVEDTHASYFLPRVSFAEAKKSLSANSVVFVDARYSADYGAGHIQGAINLPVTTSAALVPAYLHHFPKTFPVVVYCQSKSCPFSKSVATMLLLQGYTDVRLLDGGWQEWSQWKH